MVQIIERGPSFGSQLAQVLGQAGVNVAQGLQQGRAKSALDKILNPQQDVNTQGQPVQQNQPSKPMVSFGNLPQIYDLAAQGYGKDYADKLFQSQTEQLKLQGKEDLLRKKFEYQKEHDIFAKNEPELVKMEDELHNLELEDARYGRLEELFADESKFPSAVLAAALSKEGQIRPIAGALLTPEAQEAVKLITDSLSGAQNTFGGKVSNFEAATYLKGKPSLLNTAEGRKRVLQDLRLINNFNRLSDEGVLDIIQQKGGADKISLSSARRIWKKQHEGDIKEFKEKLANPTGSKFNSISQADPSKFLGRKIQNEETGEVYISDGKEWKPFIDQGTNK